MPSRVRQQVLLRAGGRCERCSVNLANLPASVHHRRPRGMGGTSDPTIDTMSNQVVLCGSGTTGCHGWVESHRAEAIEQGWLVPRRDPRDPADVPVMLATHWGAVWYLVGEGWEVA